MATSPSPQFNPLWCQPRSQMHTWEAKRARSEVMPESKELDPGWVALIWLSPVSSKTNRLRHGGLGFQTHTHKQGGKHTYIVIHTHMRGSTLRATDGVPWAWWLGLWMSWFQIQCGSRHDAQGSGVGAEDKEQRKVCTRGKDERRGDLTLFPHGGS